MDSSRGCPVVCCGKLLAIAALLLVPVAATLAVAPWNLAGDGQVSIAEQDVAGFNVVEPSALSRPTVTSGEGESVERTARDWTFTDGPRPSSNR